MSLADLVIVSCDTQGDGGGILVNNPSTRPTTLRLFNVNVEQNTTSRGGGISVRGGRDSVDNVRLVLASDAVVKGNHAFADGGGIRYRDIVVMPNTLLVNVSQSGETADTLAALKMAKGLGYLSQLAICNVPESSLVRESELSLMTRAGPEIGVASTKAFVTQLTSLLMLALELGRHHGLSKERYASGIAQLEHLPSAVTSALALDTEIKQLAERFATKQHALFLGRGTQFPIAMEGALKLKEISYIHAEAYPAGELKHGPLALVDKDMPVVAVAPNDQLLDKLKSNLQEVRARGGELYVFADLDTHIAESDGINVIQLGSHAGPLSPILHTLPLQLLSYHAALQKGTDVDKPRNLAKSVTVE